MGLRKREMTTDDLSVFTCSIDRRERIHGRDDVWSLKVSLGNITVFDAQWLSLKLMSHATAK